MKKVLFILGAAALVLASCAKSETVVKETTPGEISLMGYTGSLTKTGEMEAGFLPHNYGIYTRVTQRNADNVIENPDFFGEKIFGVEETTTFNAAGSASDIFVAGTWTGPMTATNNTFSHEAIYWPFGKARLDFLAFSVPFDKYTSTDGNWKVNWPAITTDAASEFNVTNVDTYANQVDFMYASANGQTTANNASTDGSKTVAMKFNHAQALLVFNVRTNVASKIKIHEIAFLSKAFVEARQALIKGGEDTFSDLAAPANANDVTLKTIGTFTVDNNRNDLLANWTYGATPTSKDNYAMPDGTGKSLANSDANVVNFNPYGTAVTQVTASKYDQLGDVLLIPQQDKVNFTITYEVGSKLFTYTYNDLRGVWEKGKMYIYNLDLSIYEIMIKETVEPFEAVSEAIEL